MPIIFSTTTPASPACQPPARIYFEAPDDALLARVTEKVAERMGRHLSYTFHDEAPGGVTPIILEDVGPSAQPGVIYAELPAPTASIGTDDAWHEAAMRDFADRTHAARLRCKSEQARLATLWGYVRADATPKQAAPKAAPGVGNSGFDHKTAADFLNGKTVSGEAVRTFVATSRWAHDERAALSATLLAMHGVLTSREAEIAHLKKALLEAEAAPQQEAQEPLSERDAFERDWEKRHAPAPINGRTRDDGRYGDSSIQDAWESWQARAALAAQGGK